jgi:hypothetical protein
LGVDQGVGLLGDRLEPTTISCKFANSVHSATANAR